MEQSFSPTILSVALAQTQSGIQPGVLPNSQNIAAVKADYVFSAALLKLINQSSKDFSLPQLQSASGPLVTKLAGSIEQEQAKDQGQLLPLNASILTAQLETQLKSMHLNPADSLMLGNNVSLKVIAEKFASLHAGQYLANGQEVATQDNVAPDLLPLSLSETPDKSKLLLQQLNPPVNYSGVPPLSSVNPNDTLLPNGNGDIAGGKLEQVQTALLALDSVKDFKANLNHSVDNGVSENFSPNLVSTANSKVESKRLDSTIMSHDLKSPDWANELANKVVWLTKQDVQVAQIKLNPPHLGPIEVRVSVSNEQANVSFIATHASVRDAIEAAMPKLREMFIDSGFQSLNVNVANQGNTPQQKQFFTPTTSQHIKSGNQTQDDNSIVDGITLSEKNIATIGLVDIFA